MTRIIFFGTPEEAVPALDALHQTFEVGLVVTQPDRPKGRSGRPTPPPVKEYAVSAGIPVVQPETRGALAEAIGGDAGLGVVVAYGRILRPAVLDVFEHGILNIHFSLLPRWRGAAPVARALMAGDTMTGVTIIRLDEGLDTGPVLTAQAVDIHPAEDAGQLTTRLARIGAVLLVATIPRYLSGDIAPVVQSDEGVTYAAKLEPSDRKLDDDEDVALFLGRVRGLAPVPGATLTIDGEATKILAARQEGDPPAKGVWEAPEGWPVIRVGDGAVTITQIQTPGKKPIAGDEWVRGRRTSRGRTGQGSLGGNGGQASLA